MKKETKAVDPNEIGEALQNFVKSIQTTIPDAALNMSTEARRLRALDPKENQNGSSSYH
jgi:hypothetical protein